MTKEEAIKEAIKHIKGQPLFIDQIVAHESHEKACKLIRYESDKAICNDGKKDWSFPRNEIFDPKKVINIANHLINLGFWEEGMESMILTLK